MPNDAGDWACGDAAQALGHATKLPPALDGGGVVAGGGGGGGGAFDTGALGHATKLPPALDGGGVVAGGGGGGGGAFDTGTDAGTAPWSRGEAFQAPGERVLCPHPPFRCDDATE